MRSLGVALLLLVAAACGKAKDNPFGERKPESDHVCPPDLPHAHLPDDLDQAKAAGCSVTFAMRKGPPGKESQAYEESAVCCPAR